MGGWGRRGHVEAVQPVLAAVDTPAVQPRGITARLHAFAVATCITGCAGRNITYA